MNLLHTIGAGIASIGIFLASLFGYTYAPEPVAPQTTEDLGRAVNPVGGNSYVLAGSGVSSSATSVTLTSFTIPVSSVPYTMAHFGDGVNAIGYLTIEPGSVTRQEFISFTGITQNSDGTATLTGVLRGLAPVFPYTASTTYARAHNGGSVVVISNPPQLYEAIYSYIDNATTSGAIDGSVTAKGLYETATGLEAASTTQIGGGNTTATLVLSTLISTSTGGVPSTIPVTRSDGTLDPYLLNNFVVRTITSSSTYSKPVGVKYIDVEIWGAGGGGGRTSGAGAGGGGGGAYLMVRIASSSLASSTSIVIGTGGIGSSSNAVGVAGGNTTFGNYTAFGGSGGQSESISNGQGGVGGGMFSNGTNSPTSTPAEGYPLKGVPAFNGGNIANASSTITAGAPGGSCSSATTGNSGNSVYGGGGGGCARNAVSNSAGTSIFGGNGGAGASNSGSGSNGSVPGGGGGAGEDVASGNGGNGMVRITEYF